MIAPGKAQEVERLLVSTRLSYRQIAARTGVSRATVGAIANGTRPCYAARRDRTEKPPESSGPLVRCPGCGGRVYAPCRLCRVRKKLTTESQRLRELREQAQRRILRMHLLAIVRATRERDAAAHGPDSERSIGTSKSRGPSD